jgi:hypothetical protein
MPKKGGEAEEALFSGEQELRLLVETIPTLVWRARPDGSIEYANKRVLEYFGVPIGDIVGWGWADRVHPEDVAFKVRSWLKNLETENPHDVACRFRGADGRYRWFNVRGEPLKASDGRVLRWYGVLIDIDEAKRAEDRLRRSEAHLAEAQTLSHTGSTIYSETTLLYWSEETYRIYGFDPAQGVPSFEAVLQRVHPDDRDRLLEKAERAYAEKSGYSIAYRIVLPDGTVKHLESTGRPVFSSDGKIVEFFCTNMDVTDRKCAEEALRESEYKLRQIIETVPGLLWSTEPDGELTHVNQRILAYSGMRLEDFKHDGWEAFLHPDDFPETARAFHHAIQTGTSYETVHRLRRLDGEYRWHHVRGEPLRDGQGRIIQWYGLSVDIEERKQAEDRLRRSEAYLAEAQRLSHSGVAAYNETTILYGSEETFRIWGFDPAQGVPSREAVFQRIHPGDRDRLNAEVQSAVGEKRGYSIGYRIVLPDGTVKHLETIGQPVFAASGELVEIVTTQIDVTERKRAEEALQESEYKLRQIIEAVPGLIWSTDPAGEPTHINQRMLDYTGMRFEDFKYGGWEAFLHPHDFPETARAFDHAIQTGTSFQAVTRLRRADGEFRWHQTRGEPLRDRQGRIVQWYGVSVDIDEGKRAEDLLRRSEAYLAEAQRLSHTGSAAFNDTTILYWSDETYRIFEFDPRKGLPSREAVYNRIHPDDRERAREEARRAVTRKRDYKLEYRIEITAGTVKYIEQTAHLKFSARGELVEAVCTLLDVTGRKRAEEALRESEYKLRQIMDTVPGLTWSTGQPGFMAQVQAILNVLPAYVWYAPPSGSLTFVNKRQADFLGVPKDHPLRFGIDTGAPWDVHIPFLHPDDQEEGRKYWSDSLRTGEGYEHNYRVRTAQGGYRWFHTRTEPLRASDGTLLLWVGATLDIEELKRAEEGLRESEAKFRDYAESASDWFWEIGPNYKFTLLTENAYGSDSADRIGTECWAHALDLETEPEKWRILWANLDSRKPFRDFVYCSARQNGSPIHVKVTGKPVFDSDGEFRGYRGTGTDVTAIMRAREEHERLRQLESDFAHMNRVSMMGELAASLSHEITQPTAAARNYARAALNFLDQPRPDLGEVKKQLVSIVAAADRSGEIIDRIRDHIKKAPPRKAHFDLNHAIDEVIVLARSAIARNGVSVRTLLSEKLRPVQGDRVQLQQVVLNLVLNAVEAMGSVEAGPRELLISTQQDQTGVMVAVRDSGPGLDPENLERVFGAFYTTKASGMGMGLSICRSIIDAHGGRLWAGANEPRGAVFQFTLPGSEEEITDPRSVPQQTTGPHEDSVADHLHQLACQGNK